MSRVSVRQFSAHLGAWAEGSGRLHERLSRGIGSVIERGELPGDTLLPTERELAAVLGVSRTTVVSAYNALKRDGRLVSRQGRGTWIPAAMSAARAGSTTPVTTELFGTMLGDHTGTIDLTTACPPANPVLERTIREWGVGDLTATLGGRGYLPAGVPELRAAVAGHLGDHGLPTQPEQIVITTGGHQAISLAVSLLVRPDAAVITEDPTYPGALDILRARGARVIGLPMDDAGIVVDGMGAAVAEHRPSLIYLVPSFHNPTGTVLDPERGALIADLSRRTGVPVLEDEILRDIWIQGRRPGPFLAAHEPDAPILTVGSLSKTIWGGLRLGWIRGPRSLAERLTRARLLADLGGSIVVQSLATHLIPHIDEAAEVRRATVRHAAGVAAAALDAHLPEWAHRSPQGGAALWLRMPWGDARSFAQLCHRFGVSVLPGAVMSTNGGHGDRLRVSLLGPADELHEGIARMAAAWHAYNHIAEHQPVVV